MQSSWKRSKLKKQNLKNKGEWWGCWKKEAEKKQWKSKSNNFNLFNVERIAKGEELQTPLANKFFNLNLNQDRI